MLRVATAIVLIPVLWLAIRFASAPWFLGITLVAAAIVTHECYRMFLVSGCRPLMVPGLLATGALVWSFSGVPPTFPPALPITFTVLVTMTFVMWRRPEPPAMLDTVFCTVFPVLFLGLGLGHVVALRALPDETGKDLLFLLFLCVILADTGAYYVGTTVGKRRFAPRISPKKSWEGVAGGLLASVLGAVVARYWFVHRLPIGHAVTLGVLLGFSAVVGDLAASLVKRATGVKDASTLLPGHGGLFDRTDSLMFSAPILYYYQMALLQGTV